MFQNNLLMAADAATSGGGAAVTSIGNSAFFNNTNAEDLSRTNDTAQTNTKKWTYSTWIYKCENPVTTANGLLAGGTGTNNGRTSLKFTAGSVTGNSTFDELKFELFNSSIGWVTRYSSMKLRDATGWYHIVLVYDAANAIAADTLIIYVNGVRAALDTEAAIPDNISLVNANGVATVVGAENSNTRVTFDGYMAETVMIDGLALTPTSFGEYDTTGLYWTPLPPDTIKLLTFGNNGFYLDNSSNPETDASGEGNNFTNNNTVVTSTHTPTNIHSLLNPLSKDSGITISNGNRTSTTTSAGLSVMGTLSVSAGTYYWEVDIDVAGGAMWTGIGYVDGYTDNQTQSIRYRNDGSIYKYNVEFSTGNASLANGNILGFAYDTSALTLAIYHNNTLQDTVTGVDNIPHHISLGFNNATCTIVTEEDNWTYTAPSTFVALNTTNIAAATTRTASDTNKYFQTVLYEGNGANQRIGAFQPFDSTFTVGNSAVFNTTNSLTRTIASTGSNQKATFSRWVKRGFISNIPTGVAITNTLFSQNEGTAYNMVFATFDSNNVLTFGDLTTPGAGYAWRIKTTRVFEDTSQWLHVYLAIDTTESTEADRIKVYINGVRETSFSTVSYPSLNYASAYLNTEDVINYIGPYAGATEAVSFNGYGAETAWVDGTVYAPSYFGETDTSSNRWVPKALAGITWGTNGFYQNYATSGNVGDDVSGNGNDFTNVGTVVQSADSPTTNFNTYDIVDSAGAVEYGSGSTITRNWYGANSINIGTIPLRSGKWVFEATGTTASLATHFVGVAGPLMPSGNGGAASGLSDGYMLQNDANLFINGVDSGVNASATWTTDDVIRCEIDRDNHTLQWFKNGSSILSITNVYDKNWRSCTSCTTFMATTLNSGATAFAQTPTSGFIAISQDNLAGTDQLISAFSWIKNRDATDSHMLFDRVRGATNDLHSNTTDIEVANPNTVQSFLEAGIQVGEDVQVNTVSESYVLWNWMMEATGTGSSNTTGSINTTSTLVDETLGLSISKYTGTGANATIGHGLGVAPGMIIIKNLGVTDAWAVYYGDNTDYLVLNTTAATVDDATMWNDTTPSSTVFSIGSNHQVNASSENYIAYCFAPSQFISIGSYEGNGNVNGALVPTINSLGVPIQPVWAITKSIDSTSDWDMYDKERLGYNVENAHLVADNTTVESTADNLDIVTGGLKMRIATDPNVAESYIYMAIGTPMIDTDGRIIAGR